jgi:hypothetical protein
VHGAAKPRPQPKLSNSRTVGYHLVEVPCRRGGRAVEGGGLEKLNRRFAI